MSSNIGFLSVIAQTDLMCTFVRPMPLKPERPKRGGLAYQVCFSNATSTGAWGRRIGQCCGIETHSIERSKQKAF